MHVHHEDFGDLDGRSTTPTKERREDQSLYNAVEDYSDAQAIYLQVK
jgi:hypothetical protein